MNVDDRVGAVGPCDIERARILRPLTNGKLGMFLAKYSPLEQLNEGCSIEAAERRNIESACVVDTADFDRASKRKRKRSRTRGRGNGRPGDVRFARE